MRRVLFRLVTFIIFVVAIASFYAAIVFTYPFPIINISLILLGIFLIIEGSSRIDKLYGLGKYANNNDNDSQMTS